MAEVIEALRHGAAHWPSRIAFRDHMGEVSYGALARRVAGIMETLRGGGTPIGLMAENGIGWVAADLAVTASGRRFVPLPPFFSDDQLLHVVKDSGLGLILADDALIERAARFAPVGPIPGDESDASALAGALPGERIIYTSGSTGQPKGVRLGDAQLDHVSRGLAAAISATQKDSYLSVLPFPLLLEELCGIHVPVMVGGVSTIRKDVAAECAGGNLDAIRLAFEETQPTVSVLVPELLRAWVGSLILSSTQAPASLRVVAVGGAPVPPQVLDAAGNLGIPCLEGYGLSECGSVVAVNRPGSATPGTVGRPLDGLTVTISGGEIVVEGPSVMSGYVDRPPHDGPWHTGDLGHFDEAGNLVVEGRKDAMLVTSYGRNVQPEWIEARLQGDPRILRATLAGHGQAWPTALVVPGAFAGDFFTAARPGQVLSALHEICSGVPDYALPRSYIATTNAEMQALGLTSPNGRVRRRAIEAWLRTADARSRSRTALVPEEFPK
ncbi:MAG: AMP-binding protein [Parvibaculum sp.]